MADKSSPASRVGGMRVVARPTGKKGGEAGMPAQELTGHAPNEFAHFNDDSAPSVSPATLLTFAIVYIVVVILAHFYATFTKQ